MIAYFWKKKKKLFTLDRHTENSCIINFNVGADGREQSDANVKIKIKSSLVVLEERNV